MRRNNEENQRLWNGDKSGKSGITKKLKEFNPTTAANNKSSGFLLVCLIVLFLATVGLLAGLLSKNSFCEDWQRSFRRTENASETMPEKYHGEDTPWSLSYRLPSNIVPTSYNVTLHPDLEAGTFTGKVDIAVHVTKQTYYFLVHVKQLTIDEVKVVDGHGVALDVREHFEYPANEFYVIVLRNNATSGGYVLSYRFNGSLTDGIVGFYRSQYTTNDGQKRYLATSKFEPTFARRSYPCFDEPNFRAVFNVTLVHPAQYFALSNMPVQAKTANADGTEATVFAPTVPMPTYLTCFIVCDFKFTSTTTKDGKPFRVYATPDQVGLTENALKLGKEIQDYYSTYYDIPYPLPKQDLIAIPDFVSGAMEHWGIVTFRETNLLYDPKESSLVNERRVATVVGHELAHMWFGNLVTMTWWDDLWLNEGFASYLEYLGVAHARKGWNEDEMIIVYDLQPVMSQDAGLNSHPIIQPVGRPDEITEIFDSISYSKGASILRMLDNFMGADDFRAGLHNYLKKHSFGNARTIDLWNELSNASTKKLDINTIMDTWTKQMGFPVITVKRNPERLEQFTVSQERFFLNPEDAKKANKSESPFGYYWEVPLTYRKTNGSVDTKWLHKDSEVTFDIPWAASEPFVKFNVDQTGFYKVNYEQEVWQQISKSLVTDHQHLSRADRAHLLNDAFSLSNGGYLNYSRALDLSLYLKSEKDFLPWKAVQGSISTISTLLRDTDIYEMFKTYVLNICAQQYAILGWKDEGDDLTRMLRPIILNMLCGHGHEGCLQEAYKELKDWMAGKPVSANLLPVVHCYGLESSPNKTDWDFMWEKYAKSNSALEKQKLMAGLACVKQPNLLHRYLGYAKDPSKVRSQDFFTVLNHISHNEVGTNIIWDFVREEWPYLVNRFTLNERNLGKLIPEITSSFAKDVRKQEMVDFFAKYPNAGAGARARKQALDRVQQNIDWLKRCKNDIKSWLEIQSFH